MGFSFARAYAHSDRDARIRALTGSRVRHRSNKCEPSQLAGDPAAFEAVLPLFNLMGKNIKLMGGAGAGQHTKV